MFESKNYSGWIFGSESQKTWTQTLPSRRSSVKSHFLNPIMQNKLHVKCLSEYIGDNIPIYSIIVFSNKSELKKVSISNNGYRLIKTSEAVETVNNIINANNNRISPEKVEELYKSLYPLSQVSNEVKAQHIQNIKNKM